MTRSDPSHAHQGAKYDHQAISQAELRNASEALARNKSAIIKNWETKVREHVSAAQGMPSPVMINSLAAFLDGLIGTLAAGHPLTEFGTQRGMSTLHGGQRAVYSGYFLPQLLKEFSILREVIGEKLNDEEVMTYPILKIIDQSLDLTISLAATEFVKVQEINIRAALAKAEVSNRDLEHFAAIAAHDLKSPLATISGYVNYLEEEFKENLESEGTQYIEVMKRALARMLSLIDRLLDYARLNTVHTPFQPTNTNEVVRASLQNLEDTILKLNAHVHSGTLPTVWGEPDLLTQLFQNLIANSLKFHREDPPKIEIQAEEKDGMWLFTLQDNGIGFGPKERENIFALYKKLPIATESQGSGIGLATCRKVVELHGGRIWADSQPGVGSTFYFTLPQIEKSAQAHH